MFLLGLNLMVFASAQAETKQLTRAEEIVAVKRAADENVQRYLQLMKKNRGLDAIALRLCLWRYIPVGGAHIYLHKLSQKMQKYSVDSQPH